MLIDEVKIKVKAGDGGKGLMSFDNRGKAYGGDGGRGGNVVLVGNENINDLSHFTSKKTYSAPDGGKGGIHRKDGADGEDLRIQLPLVTKVYDKEKERVVLIEKHNQEYLLLEGGQGGLGNYTLRGEGFDGKFSRKKPELVDTYNFHLELNLKADVILLGYPNAGKSSIINALTRSKSKVADYEFTTIQPQLGVMDGYIKLMDLPGLIEGTSKGKGLGTNFVKHVNYSKLLAHCISIESENLEERYNSMRKEFGKISPTLFNMNEIVILTKADIFEPEESEKKRQDFSKKINKEVILVSTYLKDSLVELRGVIKSKLDSHPNWK